MIRLLFLVLLVACFCTSASAVDIEQFQTTHIWVGFAGLDYDGKMQPALDKCKAILEPVEKSDDQSLCRWKVKPTKEAVRMILSVFDRAIPTNN